MSVKIRLRRIGRKKQPYYRIVATDSAAARDGAYLDTIGFYNPRRQPAELRMDLEKLDRWLADGAGLTDTVASLVRKARRGGDRKVELKPMKGAEPAPVQVIEAEQPKARAGTRGKGGRPGETAQELAEDVSQPRPDRGETGPQGPPLAAETAE
jgi:small subunit ribosomal protein S16